MSPRSPELAERVRANIKYDPETGVLAYTKSRAAIRCDARGYVRIVIDYKTILTGHRVAWLLHYGRWPDGMLDHINRDRADNRISNLREANKSSNAQNAAARSRVGFKGVTFRGARYLAALKHNGKTKHLGLYSTPQEAALAYDEAARQTWGAEACTNRSLGLLGDTP